jgi:hypothetical protein
MSMRNPSSAGEHPVNTATMILARKDSQSKGLQLSQVGQ